jgi:hypothetical protein
MGRSPISRCRVWARAVVAHAVGASEKRNKFSPPHSITSSATNVQVPAFKHNPIMPGAGRGVRRFTIETAGLQRAGLSTRPCR